jgi:hypothetical protein
MSNLIANGSIEKYRGYYVVGTEKFVSKSAALYRSLTTGQEIVWYFHNRIWDDFYEKNKNNLGQTNLQILYQQRAKQLREKYDYLILHYSGGADSHNVLMTFLNANIKLDEIFVRRQDEVESKLYTPDKNNTSPENILSEYDYAQLPTMQWLSLHHPEIRITTSTVFDNNIDTLINDDSFLAMPHTMSLMDNFRQGARSPNERKLIDKGLNICNIFGNDKPIVYSVGRDCLMTFTDSGLSAGLDLMNVEAFYWTADMPALPFSQAYLVYKYFNLFPQHRWVIEKSEFSSMNRMSADLRENLLKKILYKDTWDFSRFQTTKGLEPYKGDFIIPARDVLYLQHPFFQRLHDRWLYHYKNWDIKQISCPTLKWNTNKTWWLGSFD